MHLWNLYYGEIKLRGTYILRISDLTSSSKHREEFHSKENHHFNRIVAAKRFHGEMMFVKLISFVYVYMESTY